MKAAEMPLSSTLYLVAMRLAPLVFTIILLVTTALNTISPGPDPYRCDALMNNGSWLNAPDANGTRKPYTNWQPDGCMLRSYDKPDIHECMEGRIMVFSGDSTTRQVFWAMGRLLDREKSIHGRDKAATHESYDMTFNGTRMLQIWNPYLETTEAHQDLTDELQIFIDEKRNNVLANSTTALTNNTTSANTTIWEGDSAGLIMLGAGSWYSLNYFEKQAIHDFAGAMENITNILRLEDLPPFGSRPMDPRDGVGNEIFIAPVAPPFMKELQAERKGPEGIQPGEIQHIDDMLLDVAQDHNLRMLWSFPELSRNQKKAIVDITQTGFHVIDVVAEIKATILLNLRCNAKLDARQGYPYDRTCCTDYGASVRPLSQSLIISLLILYVLACVAFELFHLTAPATQTSSSYLSLNVGMFAVALLYCFYADRTHLFAKGSKEYVASDFTLLLVLVAIVGLVTIRKSHLKKPQSIAPQGAVPAEEDHGTISRDQADEWKGWMQAAILIYHWTGASRSLPVYIFIRLLVAAYLFQTGYGHTIYFLTKKDFSFHRFASVLLRLNLLSCALPYIMGTDYMFYYFAPLVSYWFLIIYATLAIGSRYNDNPIAVVSKIFVSLFCVWMIMNHTPLCERLFDVLRYVFHIKWDLHEWKFRANLDGVIVFVGMLSGLAYTRIQRSSSIWFDYRMGFVPGLMGVAWYTQYFTANYTKKADYNHIHTLVSFLPILGFIAVRNAFRPLRNYYSKAAAWLGRCSLETFVLQFHIYLAADTKGVLLLDVFRGGDGSLLGDRWRDLVVIVPVFLWISSCVSESTGLIVKSLTAKPQDQPYDPEDAAAGQGHHAKLFEGYRTPTLTRFLSLSRRTLQDLRVKCVLLLGFMWVLNLLS